jgi:hypothetical protein
MRDVRKQLVIGLITAINAKATGLTVYTKIPKGDASNPISYPYIFIAEIFDTEDGPKNKFMYQYEVTLQVVYKDLTSKLDMWTTVDLIKQIINNDSPFTLTDNFKIMEAILIDTDETEDLVDSQDVDTTIIRINFMIEDNN